MERDDLQKEIIKLKQQIVSTKHSSVQNSLQFAQWFIESKSDVGSGGKEAVGDEGSGVSSGSGFCSYDNSLERSSKDKVRFFGLCYYCSLLE